MILRDSIEILNELFNGDYIPNINDIDKRSEDEQDVLISPYGLNKLYLDFRFLMITLANFLSANSKHLITSICEKAKKYVNFKYNLQINVDWKLMHSLGMRLQYKALTGDELDVLNKAYLSQPDNNEENTENTEIIKTTPITRDRNGTKKRHSGSVKNKNNPFL